MHSGMGALNRATRNELAECAGDADFWPSFFAGIAGGRTLRDFCEERRWSYGETYRWIRADEGLSAAYDEAKRGQAEYKVDEAVATVALAGVDDVAVAKLKSEFALKVAGKWDRARYGEKLEHTGGVLVGSVSEVLRMISERKQGQMRAALASPPEPPALEHIPARAEAVTEDGFI
jgi:hypothetical protein